jgi:hypothetical protein
MHKNIQRILQGRENTKVLVEINAGAENCIIIISFLFQNHQLQHSKPKCMKFFGNE